MGSDPHSPTSKRVDWPRRTRLERISPPSWTPSPAPGIAHVCREAQARGHEEEELLHLSLAFYKLLVFSNLCLTERVEFEILFRKLLILRDIPSKAQSLPCFVPCPIAYNPELPDAPSMAENSNTETPRGTRLGNLHMRNGSPRTFPSQGTISDGPVRMAVGVDYSGAETPDSIVEDSALTSPRARQPGIRSDAVQSTVGIGRGMAFQSASATNSRTTS
jgi:hypothetical protein